MFCFVFTKATLELQEGAQGCSWCRPHPLCCHLEFIRCRFAGTHGCFLPDGAAGTIWVQAQSASPALTARVAEMEIANVESVTLKQAAGLCFPVCATK